MSRLALESLLAMPPPFSVVAIIAAYNEADIIGTVVGDLIQQGIEVYFLDDGSTDGTVAAVEPYLNRGVLAIERLSPADSGGFDWERILRRKTQLATELDASWFIHHDADEFRESPWAQLSLKDAIRHVDALGFNAIDFAGLDFWPTDDRFRPGTDVREALTWCSELASHDRLQIRCWKKTDRLDLASSGGHEAQFPDRRVFPLRFILRHYPIRGQEHGDRKVFQERQNRFLARERERGWHVQYDHLHEGMSFIKDPSTLTAFDADAARVALTLHHRRAEELEASVDAARREIDALQAETGPLRAEIARLGAECVRRDAVLADLRVDLERRTSEVTAAHASMRKTLDLYTADIERWRTTVNGLTHQLDELRQSLSWRCTAPARAAYRLLTRARS
jgi:hypothetical protein